ncbi:MAG TPA: Uma2 family endonuclease [Thermoanaerobaculia bacterium]|jgi:Uma2 family endonuclease|nr:Uma2 family endonuclease [Thermoanaerobaculia bacterium]
MAQPAIPRTLLDGEDGARWPLQGRWTYEDYLRLPDDGNRYEVIRGHLYVTAAPIYDHQYAVLKLSRFLDEHVSAAELGVVLAAPFDVLLPFGIGTPVEPDVLFFRAGNEPGGGDKNYEGVPDLIAEVLSPKTRRRDRTVKLQAYQDAGAPEYWLVDPGTRTVLVYVLGPGKPGKRYTELCRGAEGERVRSSILPGFDLAVADLFPRRK